MSKKLLAKDVNEYLSKELKEKIKTLSTYSIKPCLATLRIGQNPSDISYEKSAKKKLESLGITVHNEVLDFDVSQDKAIEIIQRLAYRYDVHGILVFQPLPDHINAIELISKIPYNKDVDGSSLINQALVLLGKKNAISYCAPAAVIELLDYYGIDLEGKNITIIGRGPVVGRPLALLLTARSATVTLCHSKTRDLSNHCKRADILIGAAGKPGMIDENMVSPGQIVLDIGTTYKDGRLRGDINAEAIENIVAAYSPTPGGIGGITNMVLAKNVVNSAMTFYKNNFLDDNL